ncbi:MAG: hypothetical protein COB04_06495 [Gammaproteobacteria bacterium]|nr:MAG: hypothetical protein COB04_06495 [Gammaproteobacteria bacterium]
MRCNQCDFESPKGMKFCGGCGQGLQSGCASCGFENPAGFKFCGQCAESLAASSDAGAKSDSASKSQLPIESKSIPEDDLFYGNQEAERRQITVLFCDIVGSSAISEQLDPEDFREVLRDYRQSCSTVISKYDGYVAQFLGDGVLCYFGYPHAHEDDARRAVAAAIELLATIKVLCNKVEQAKGVSLSVRIGAHTGLVVVGEVGGGDKRTVALGATPNLAARIQDQARPDSIVVSAVTYRLISSAFECDDMGVFDLKGFSSPIRLHQPLRAYPTPQKFAEAVCMDSLPLIGRDRELNLLKGLLQEATEGRGQVAMISGEPGMGKSRLISSTKEAVDDKTYSLLECWGRAYYQNSYMHPIIDLLRREMYIEGSQSERQKLKRIERVLSVFGLPLGDSIPLIASLLSVDLSGSKYSSLRLPPPQNKQKTFQALISLIIAMSGQRPLVIVIEDLHWIDPSSLEFLNLLVKKASAARILLLLSYRKEFSPVWGSHPSITHLPLDRLNQHDSYLLINKIAGDKSLPMELLKQIADKTDGTPYFIEEITRMVLESDLVAENEDSFELQKPMDSLSIPSTLRDSLMAKIDRLGPTKELAQLSSTLGREFAVELLEAVTARGEGKLRDDLSQLVVADIIDPRGQSVFSFRHALIHEVAYRSLLKSTRQKFHRRIATILREQFPDLVNENPEIQAHHCTEAGQLEEAVFQWLSAAKRAMQRSANIEAIVHLTRGLDTLERVKANDASLLESDGEGESNRQQFIASLELAFQSSLGLALMMSKGYGAPGVELAYSRARELCKGINDVGTVFPVLCGLWGFYLVRSKMDTAIDLASQLKLLAEQSGNVKFIDEANRAMGSTLFWSGRFPEAWTILSASGIKINSQENISGRRTPSYTQDTRVANLSDEGCVLLLRGYPDQALDKAMESLNLADKMAHPFSQAYARHFVCCIYQLRGDIGGVLKQAKLQIALAGSYDFSFWRSAGRMFEAYANACFGYGADNIALYEEALKCHCDSGNELASSYFRILFAGLLFDEGDIERAREVSEEALAQIESSGERWFQGEAMRVKAMLYWRGENDLLKAEKAYQETLDFARQQDSSFLILRVASDIGQLWVAQNRDEEARKLLRATLDGVTEGFKTQDYRNASRLLEQLEAVPA